MEKRNIPLYVACLKGKPDCDIPSLIKTGCTSHGQIYMALGNRWKLVQLEQEVKEEPVYSEESGPKFKKTKRIYLEPLYSVVIKGLMSIKDLKQKEYFTDEEIKQFFEFPEHRHLQVKLDFNNKH